MTCKQTDDETKEQTDDETKEQRCSIWSIICLTLVLGVIGGMVYICSQDTHYPCNKFESEMTGHTCTYKYSNITEIQEAQLLYNHQVDRRTWVCLERCAFKENGTTAINECDPGCDDVPCWKHLLMMALVLSSPILMVCILSCCAQKKSEEISIV